MLRRILQAINRVEGVPRRVMLGGILGGSALLAAAVCLLYNGTYQEMVLSRQMCQTGVGLFAEGMILGLFLDGFLKNQGI